MLTNQQASGLGLLVHYAMAMHKADRTNQTPPADPRLAPAWVLRGHLVATDRVLGRVERTCYGFLAEAVAAPGHFALAVRGTEGVLEWLKDAQFLPVAHPTVPACVEGGFWDIYRSAQYVPLSGVTTPAWIGLPIAVGDGSLVVLGHSLGSALGTLLTFDLAASMAARVSACLFASPRVGDAAFARAFAARVRDYCLFNYVLDFVPRVPFGPDYADLPHVSWIDRDSSQAHIMLDALCNHHVLCYCAMLDYGLCDWRLLAPLNGDESACILGPSPAAAAGGLAL